MPRTPIATADLKAEHLPRPDAGLFELDDFAHTFDGYDHAGNGLGALTRRLEAEFQQSGTVTASLDELRAALFLLGCGWSKTGSAAEEELEFARALVAAIPAKLA